MPDYTLDASRCALIIQDLQNDVIIDGGAFADSGAPEHAKEQNVVENVKGLAAFCRGKGIPVIHVWYIVEEGAPGLKLNAPLFQGVKDTDALVRGSWGAAPAEGLEAQDGDFVVEKMRMSAWQGTRLENLLEGLGRDTVIVTGAWTNMSDRAHLAHGRGQGLLHGRAGGRLLDDERRLAQRVDQLRAPERLDGDELRRRQGSAGLILIAKRESAEADSRCLIPAFGEGTSLKAATSSPRSRCSSSSRCGSPQRIPSLDPRLRRGTSLKASTSSPRSHCSSSTRSGVSHSGFRRLIPAFGGADP